MTCPACLGDCGKPSLVDLFSGAGGACKGYQRAGFCVLGVDVVAQPRYCGDRFVQADALTWPLEGFDAIHASPPCQRYMLSGNVDREQHPDLLGPTRDLLEATGLPYVIENVPGAPMRTDVMLCGSMFGLAVRRHRRFESNVPLPPWTLSCRHDQPITGVYGHPHGAGGAYDGMLPGDLKTWSEAMDIDWMTTAELADAIPPAYTEWIGERLMQALTDQHKEAERG